MQVKQGANLATPPERIEVTFYLPFTPFAHLFDCGNKMKILILSTIFLTTHSAFIDSRSCCAQVAEESLAAKMFAELTRKQTIDLESFIGNEKLLNRLTLSDSQKDKIANIASETDAKISGLRDQFHEIDVLKSVTEKSSIDITEEKIKALQGTQLDSMFGVLVPAQQRRLMQMMNQAILSRDSLFNEYRQSADFDGLADISKPERVCLNEQIHTSKTEFEKELEKLWHDYHEELRSLFPTTRADMDRLFGEPAPLRLRFD